MLLSLASAVDALLPEVIKGKGDMWLRNHTEGVVSTTGDCILGTQTGCSSSVANGLTNQIIAVSSHWMNSGYIAQAHAPSRVVQLTAWQQQPLLKTISSL